jgi:hypothetical protein
MNLVLMTGVVKKKGKFFIAACDIEDMKAGKADTSFEELEGCMAINHFKLVQKSPQMFAVEQIKNRIQFV